MKLSSGQRFGNYEILNQLGSGGMGEVYLALDSRLKRNVALKVISSESLENTELLARFKREAGLEALLNHPNICTIYETGEVEGQTFISMEHIEGKTLQERIAGEPLELNETLEIAIQIADALDEARKKNVVHRDIKSSNIMLTRRNLVKVLDFGLAKRTGGSKTPASSTADTESSITHGGGVRGTFAYMSPEQAYAKPVDHRSDIFSFGVVLYEMLTGRLPFTGSSVTEVVDAILHKSPPAVTRYNDQVPPELVLVLNKMLEKDPENRYQSVHEVWVDLRRIKGESTSKDPQGIHWREQRSRHIRSVLALPAIVILSVLAVFALFRFRGLSKTQVDRAAAKPEAVSLAVLPFQYAGPDPTRVYLGMLMTDGLIASLQAVQGIAVAPMNNVRDFKKEDSIAKVARGLGVKWVVRGVVSAEGDGAEVTAELFSSSGSSVWKKTLVERPVVAIDLASKSLLEALHVDGVAARETDQLRTPSLDAYRKYLEARSLQEGWDVKNNMDQAIVLYRETLQMDPDFAAARAGLATALVTEFASKHDPALLAQASDEARRALGLDANLPEALLAFGMVQAQSGKSVEARDAFSRALELAPGDDAAYRSLADMYSNLGRNKEAREMHLKAIALRPTYWRNYYAIGTFEWQSAGNVTEARRYLEKADNLHPEGYATLVLLGNICLTRGLLADAELYYRKALERAPNNYAYSNLGLVHYYRGQYELALRNWEALLKDSPEYANYQANVADALRQMGRKPEAEVAYGKAIRLFRGVLKTNPGDDRTIACMSMALAAVGQCQEAIKETRDVISRHPESTELAGYAALTYGRCGEIDMSKQVVLNSIAADNVLTIRFDPDLEQTRKLPEVKQALETARHQ